MKRICIALMLAVVIPVAAAKPKVYDHVGSVRYVSINSDSEAHVTVGGTTYDSYCTTTISGVSCSDTGGVFYIKLDSRKQYTFFMDLGLANASTKDAIMEVEAAHKAPTFTYRLMHPKRNIEDMILEPSICVPFTNAKGKPDEACYILTPSVAFAPTPPSTPAK